MTFGDVILFLLAGIMVVSIAFAGAFTVGGLIATGIFIARHISKKLPELWEKLP